MTAFEQITRDDISDPHIRAAVDKLVRVSSWGSSYLVSMPLVYPSGTVVGVKVTPARGGYEVTDFAMGFREAEAFEAQRSYGQHAGRLKEQLGVEYNANHEIVIQATEAQIGWAIRQVAYASHRIATKTHAAAPAWDEQEIGAALYQRLRDMFGESRVASEALVHGASNLDWKFAAEVKLGGRRVFFDVVTPHHSSVFSAVSKFSDVRRLGPKTLPVAVVGSVAKMGKWLPLVAQEAEVIEADATDDALRSLVSEAA